MEVGLFFCSSNFDEYSILWPPKEVQELALVLLPEYVDVGVITTNSGFPEFFEHLLHEFTVFQFWEMIYRC